MENFVRGVKGGEELEVYLGGLLLSKGFKYYFGHSFG